VLEISRRLRPHLKMMSIVVTCIALSLAITSVTQSIASLLLVAPLPFQNADRLAEIRLMIANKAGVFPGNNAAVAKEWSDLLKPDVQTAFLVSKNRRLRLGGIDRIVRASYVDANYFRIFGTPRGAGDQWLRAFESQEDVVIVRRSLYDRILRGPAPQFLKIDNTDYRVLQIVDPQYASPLALAGRPEDVWLPLKRAPLDYGNRSGFGSSLKIFALLPNEKGFSEAETRLTSVALPSVKAETVNVFPHGTQLSIAVSPLRETILGTSAITAAVFLMSSYLIYVLVCSVVAQYIVSILSTRWRTQFIKHVLGATRRMLVIETIADLSIGVAVACVLSLILAAITMSALKRSFADAIPRIAEAGLDVRFFVGFFALVGAAFIIIAIAVVVRINRTTTAMLTAGVKGSAGPAHAAVNRWVIGIQFVLVTVSILLTSFAIVGLVQKLTLSVGFSTAGVTAVQVDLPERLQSTDAKRLVAEKIRSKFQESPLHATIAYADLLPLSPSFTLSKVQRLKGNSSLMVNVTGVDDSYLDLLGLRPVGRMFTREETNENQRVAIISKSLKDTLFPFGPYLGEDMQIAHNVFKIVGVVDDVQNPFRSDRSKQFQAYVPIEFFPEATDISLLLTNRAGEHPSAIDITAIIHSVDSELFVESVEPLSDTYFRALNRGLFQTLVAAISFAVALGIAALIVYLSVTNNYAESRRYTLIKASLGAEVGPLLHSLVANTFVGIGIACLVSCALLLASHFAGARMFGGFFAENLSLSLALWASCLLAISAFCIVLTRRLLNSDLVDLSSALQ